MNHCCKISHHAVISVKQAALTFDASVKPVILEILRLIRIMPDWIRHGLKGFYLNRPFRSGNHQLTSGKAAMFTGTGFYERYPVIVSAHTKHDGFGFIKFCKFTMKRQMRLEIIGLSAFWVTEILTANRLLSNTAEETDFLNGLPFAI